MDVLTNIILVTILQYEYQIIMYIQNKYVVCQHFIKSQKNK